MTSVWAAGKTIDIGKYPTFRLFGLTFDANIIASTLVVAVIFLILGAILRKKLTDGVPGKFQLLFEAIVVDIVGNLAQSAVGERYRRFLPLGFTLFLFILLSNWIGFIPTALHPGSSYDILPPPTSDVNLPMAMALLVIIWMHYESVKARRPLGYLRHYRQPNRLFIPINVIEELVKPVTLSFRLFGNLFSGVIMLSVITVLLPIYVVPVAEVLWKPFDDIFIGGLQAYIFMLLTILYMGMATSHDEEPAHTAPALASHAA